MTFKQLREDAGLVQADIAAALDVGQSAVSNWERGQGQPSRKYRQRLASMLHCTMEELDMAIVETRGLV